MNLRTRAILAATALALTAAGLTACSTDADVVNKNISTDADNFKVNRRFVFFNGITDKYLLTIEGFCSLDASDPKKLAVTCKVGDTVYKRSYLGLSDNVSWYAEQLDGAKVSAYHYEVIFRPSELVPDVVVP